MNTKKIGFWLVLLTLAMAIMACEFEASTANITNAVMTKDEAGSTQTTVYAPKDAFFCIVSLANAPDDTKVKAVWTAVDVAGVAANTQILEKEMVTGLSKLTFTLTNDNPWPAGKYKVDIQLNGTTAKTVEFQVK